MTLSSNPFSDFLGMWGFQWCEQTSQGNLHKYGWNFRKCLFALMLMFESTLNCTGSLYCFLFFLIYYYYLVALGLCCCMRAFSRCRAHAHYLWPEGLAASKHMGSSWTRDQTHVPCIGRWILNYKTTREAPKIVCFDVVLFGLILYGSFHTSCTWVTASFLMWGTFSSMCLPICSQPLSHLLLEPL